MDSSLKVGELGDTSGAFWYDQSFPELGGELPGFTGLPLQPSVPAGAVPLPLAAAGGTPGPLPVSVPIDAMAAQPVAQQPLVPLAVPVAPAADNSGPGPAGQEEEEEGEPRPPLRKPGRSTRPTAQEKAARLDAQRARNRVNLARYRERQKEKNAAVAAQHEGAAADLERVRSDCKLLATQNTVLEKLLVTRDVAVGILEAQKRDSAASEGGACIADGVRGGPHLADGLGGRPLVRELSSSLGGATLASRATDASLSATLSASDEGGSQVLCTDALSGLVGSLRLPESVEPERLAASASANPGDDHDSHTEAHATAVRELLAAQPQLLERLREQTAEGFVEEWRVTQLALRGVFQKYEATGHPAVLDRVKPLMEDRMSCGG